MEFFRYLEHNKQAGRLRYVSQASSLPFDTEKHTFYFCCIAARTVNDVASRSANLASRRRRGLEKI